MAISVVICTHNPRQEYLERVLVSLQTQTLKKDEWELLIIDNASQRTISADTANWHRRGRVIREDKLGLTNARLRGIRESSGELVIFVDDDNLLSSNFLQIAATIFRDWPHIGAWSGQCHAEFETAPATWLRKYMGMLVVREFSKDSWSNLPHIGETMPCGAGLCVRRAVADAYLALHDSGQRPLLLDRQGTSLMSAGDNDLSACACDIGLGVGLFHKLELTHLISAQRTSEEYLVRLADGIYYSAVYLQAFRGRKPPMKSAAKKLLEIAQGWRMSACDRRIFAACCRGENRTAGTSPQTYLHQATGTGDSMSKVLNMLFSHRTLALLRWDLYFLRMRLANRLVGTAGKIQSHVAGMPSPRYLNLGSGPRGVVDPHWLNIDGFIDKNVHYRLDFSRTWPIPDGSMDGVFCEHVLEHFTLEDGIALLGQCCRILKPGGTVRFIMPNAQIIMRTYFDAPALLVEKRLPNSGTPMDAVNGWFRQRYEHQCLYDWSLAEYAFRKAGFSKVEHSEFSKSQLVPPALLIDDPKYAWESLYIDARKAY